MILLCPAAPSRTAASISKSQRGRVAGAKSTIASVPIVVSLAWPWCLWWLIIGY